MKTIKHVCFDLDGTLCNSHSTIYQATIKTLETLGITDVLDQLEFNSRIGHQFSDIFNDLNIKISDIEHFINIYKSYYFDYIEDSLLYPEVNIILEHLIQNDCSVSLLTTKSQGQADKILKHFNIDKYFKMIVGRRNGMPVKPAGEPLIFICKELSIPPVDTIMVGDSELDIQCGRNAGTKTCAVSYGYRDLKFLTDEDPDYIIDNLMELKDII